MSSASRTRQTTPKSLTPGRPTLLKRIPPPVFDDLVPTENQTAGPEPAGSSGASHSGAGSVPGGSKARKEPAPRMDAREASPPVLEGRARRPSQTAGGESAPGSAASRRSRNGMGGVENGAKALKEPATRTGERKAKSKAGGGSRAGEKASETAFDGQPVTSDTRLAAAGGAKEKTRRVTCEEILSRYCDRFGFELARVTKSRPTGKEKGKRGVEVKIAGRLVGIGKGETTFEAIVDGYEDTVRYFFREDKVLRNELVYKGEVVAWKVASKGAGDKEK